jgi:hypothetical protein
VSVRQPTQWQAPSGTGYFNANGGVNLTTLSGSNLTTLSLVQLTTDALTYSPKYASSWTVSTRNKTSWTPPSGSGYVVQQGTLDLVTNSGAYLVDNLSNNLVTNTTYNKGKFATQWTAVGV